MSKVQSATSPEERTAAWTELFDPQSTFKLLYCLKIIQGEYLSENQVAAQSSNHQSNEESKSVDAT